MKRILATLIFIALHVVYYLIFSLFLEGKIFALVVYGCTVITFVLIDGWLIKGMNRNGQN